MIEGDYVASEERILAALAENVKASDACLGLNMQEHVSALYTQEHLLGTALEHLHIHGTMTGRWSSNRKFLSVPRIPRIPMPPALPDRRAAIQHTRRKHARG